MSRTTPAAEAALDAAAKKVSDEPGRVDLLQIPLQLAPGRLAHIVIPKDLLAIEVIRIIAFLSAKDGLQAKLNEANAGPVLVRAASLDALKRGG